MKANRITRGKIGARKYVIAKIVKLAESSD
jgi:hypothetical protein